MKQDCFWSTTLAKMSCDSIVLTLFDPILYGALTATAFGFLFHFIKRTQSTTCLHSMAFIFGMAATITLLSTFISTTFKCLYTLHTDCAFRVHDADLAYRHKLYHIRICISGSCFLIWHPVFAAYFVIILPTLHHISFDHL